jgi:hypothetical protein
MKYGERERHTQRERERERERQTHFNNPCTCKIYPTIGMERIPPIGRINANREVRCKEMVSDPEMAKSWSDTVAM